MEALMIMRVSGATPRSFVAMLCVRKFENGGWTEYRGIESLE